MCNNKLTGARIAHDDTNDKQNVKKETNTTRKILKTSDIM